MKAIIRMLSIAVLSVAAAGAQAGAYPDRPIRLVVPFPPGGTTDLLGRVFAERLADSLGRQVVVENRPGAGGVIGSDVVAKAPADGYTLLFGTVGTQSINGSLYKQLPFDIDKDFTPLGLFAGVPNILVVNPAVPARNVQELIAYARQNPGQLNMGSAGNGTTNHLSGELFKSMAQVDIMHVPYKGSGPALADLMGGQVDMVFDTMPTLMSQVANPKLRFIGVTTAARAPALPDVPTLQEQGIAGYDLSTRYAMLAPRDTPDQVVQRLSAAMRQAAGQPSVRQAMAGQGATAVPTTPQQTDQALRDEIAIWADVVKNADLK